MKNSEILIKAKSLIDTPEKWFKGNWANEDGTCMCSMGAIVKALGDNPLVLLENCEAATDYYHRHPATNILKEAMNVDLLYRGSIATINDFDETTHADIMGYFDKAIELAKGGESA